MNTIRLLISASVAWQVHFPHRTLGVIPSYRYNVAQSLVPVDPFWFLTSPVLSTCFKGIVNTPGTISASNRSTYIQELETSFPTFASFDSQPPNFGKQILNSRGQVKDTKSNFSSFVYENELIVWKPNEIKVQNFTQQPKLVIGLRFQGQKVKDNVAGGRLVIIKPNFTQGTKCSVTYTNAAFVKYRTTYRECTAKRSQFKVTRDQHDQQMHLE